MNPFAGRSAFDIFKICAYGAAILGGLTAATLQPILLPWGVDTPTVNLISARIVSISLALGLIASCANVFKNPTPTQQAVVQDEVSQSPVVVDVHSEPQSKVGT